MIEEKDRERLIETIRDIEAQTAGEIVIVVARQASSYRSVPVLWALLAALTSCWPLIWILELSAQRFAIVQLLVAIGLTIILSRQRRRYVLVPGFIKRARAHEAAMREFVARGLTRTRGRTGVLIYVAAAEHYAEILADTGIADKVDDKAWQDAIDDLIDAIRAGCPAEGLVAAVRRVGAILAEHAPPRLDDTDELPNRVILA